jgi:hypothetical protein
LLAHRIGREKLDAGRIDTPNVLTTNREAVPIEKFKDLDCDLATVVKTVTELCRRKSSVWSSAGNINGDFRHRLHHRSQEKMIVRDFIGIAASCRHVQQPAHKGFIEVHGAGDVTHARWAERLAREPGPHHGPGLLLVLGELHLMVRPPHPHPIEHDLAGINKPIDRRQKHSWRQECLIASAQLFKPDARQVGARAVEGVEAGNNSRLQPLPAGGQHGDAAGICWQQNKPKLGLDARRKCRPDGSIAKKRVQIEPLARPC